MAGSRPKFPTAIGILLGIALAAHIAAIVQAGFGEPIEGATFFLIGQAALAFGLLRLIDGAWVFQDIRVSFLLCFVLYGATLPLWLVWNGAHIPGVAGAAFLYGTGLLAFNLVQWWHRQPWRDLPASAFEGTRPSFTNALIVLLLLVLIIAYAVSRGIRLSLSIDRFQVHVLGTQLWVVAMFAMNGVAMFMIAGWDRVGPAARIVAFTSLVAFILFHVSLGDRRDFLPMLLFLAARVATKRAAVVRLGTIVVGLAGFVALLVIGLARQLILDPRLLARNPVELFVSTTEFVNPIQTLVHYVIAHRALEWGWTYLSAPLLFVPRALWPEKPLGLSQQFMLDAFGSTAVMGYAYTPVTEAYLNFGWVGPFFVMAILSLLMVHLVKRAVDIPVFYLICFAYVVDFNRGEFGGTFYSLVFVAAGYGFMHLVSRLRWTPSVLQARQAVRPDLSESARRSALTT